MKTSDYPFTREAAEQVRASGYSLEALLEKPAFQPVRRRASERALGAIGGNGIPEGYINSDIELLSYPLARIIVSCVGDELLIRRYALAEAKLARSRMQKERGDLLPLAEDLGLNPTSSGGVLRLHFAEYLRAAHRMKSPRWKLVNRDLSGGQVTVTREELTRLMEEAARDRVQKGLPVEVGEEISSKLSDYIFQVKADLGRVKASQRADLGKATEGAFPPCISMMLSQTASGGNLAHSARFALTSFLLRVNMSVDDVVGLFNTSPDFDEERTRYQVEHIAGSSGTRYKPPSCATMATYGNCPGEDDLCRRVHHPLSYYERKMKSLPRKPEDKTPEGAQFIQRAQPQAGSSCPGSSTPPSGPS
jgi:DNA primase large subunit